MLDPQAPAQSTPVAAPPIDLGGGFVPKAGAAPAQSAPASASAAQPASGNMDLSGGFTPKPATTPAATFGDKIFGRNPVSDTASTVGQHLSDAVTVPYHMITDPPKNTTEKVVRMLGPAGLPLYRFLLSQGASMEDALTEAAKQAKSGNIAPMNNYDDKGQYHPSAQSSLMDAVPILGPMYRGFSNEANTKGVLPAVAGLVTDVLAPEAAIKGAGAVIRGATALPADVAAGTARALTGTSERATKQAVQDIAKTNKTAIAAATDADVEKAKTHSDEVRDVLASNQAARESAVGTAEFQNRANQQQADAANQAATEAHQQKVAKVTQANTDALAQHQADTESATQHNQALEQTAALRDQTASELADKTQAYFEKEAQTKAVAKAENDANWKAWRDKTAGTEVDMAPVKATIDKLTTKFPEVGQILHETSLEPAEGSPAMNEFLDKRAQVMESKGYEGDYESQHPDKQAEVDALMKKLDITPGGDEFDPDALKSMPIDKLHDLKTQIGWKLFRNEFPPNVKFAMTKIFKALQDAESQGSIAAGATDELLNARTSHGVYQDAFGRVKPTRLTQEQARMKQANPEAFAEQQERARSNAAAVYDPSLVEDYNDVKQLRDRVKTFPNDEQLRKQAKQLPEPPQLQEPPEPPQPQTAAPLVVKRPAVEEVPNRPEPTKPKTTIVTPESMEEDKRAAAQNNAGKLADFTQYKVATAAGSAIGIFKAAAGLLAGSGAGVAAAGRWGLTGAGVVLGVHLLGKLLESDKVIDALAKPTRSDFEQAMKLPADQRAGIEEAIRKMNAQARRTGKLKSDSPWIPFLRGLGVVSAAQKQMQQQQQQAQPQPQSQSPSAIPPRPQQSVVPATARASQ